MNKKVLIIGNLGYVGCVLNKYLNQNDSEVFGLNANRFGDDKIMTTAAFTIHQQLVEEEGFDPKSDEYYTEVDSRIRKEFPHKFQTAKKSGGAQVAAAAASASRSTAQSSHPKGRRLPHHWA